MKLRKDKIFNITIVSIIIFGVILRLRTFLYASAMRGDELSLGMNILNRNIWEYFLPLSNNQTAPPLFMMASKFMTMIFGIHELSLRVVPFIVAIAALPLFYYFSKSFLDKKWSIILANILFAVNYRLIYYSQEFKQYSTDVLFVMLALILCAKINLGQLSKKQSLLYGAAAILLPLISLPTVFVIAAFTLGQLIKFRKPIIVKLSLFLTPFLTGMLFYYKCKLLPEQEKLLVSFPDFWNGGFLSVDPVMTIKVSLGYYFGCSETWLAMFIFILALIGVLAIFFDKEKRKDVSLLILLMLGMVIAASCLHLYPIERRVSLYLLPIAIILMTKIFDSISFKHKVIPFGILILVSVPLCFNICKDCFNPDIFITQDSKSVMKILSENYSRDEYIVTVGPSISAYKFYSRYFNLQTDKVTNIGPKNIGKRSFIKKLNSLPEGKTYWFYASRATPVNRWMKEWASDKNILLQKEIKGSYLLHLKK